ncbi:unnamed protein product [Rotaria sp. Silwood2]|nr:unnamed protein product [Rotaria sp. Silwood2]
MFEFHLLRLIYNYFRLKFTSLNLYDSRSTDPTTVHHEILSTRLFTFLFGASLAILTIFTSFRPQTTLQNIQSPSIFDYERLLKQYPNTVQCPCTFISIPYETFITIETSFHQVCSIANETLPGIVIDCLPLQAIYASSFECFYNQSCLNMLFKAYSNKMDIQILNKSLPSRFPLTASIKTLIDDLFIEKMMIQTNYDLYFNACRSVYCSYTYTQRFHWVYAITTLIAQYGGLNTAFYIITPYLIDLLLFLKKKILRNNRTQQDEGKYSNISDNDGLYWDLLTVFIFQCMHIACIY